MASHFSMLYKKGMKEDKNEWDDSKLIAAYDKAMIAAKEQAKKKAMASMNGKIQSKKKKNWKVGDYCQAPFAEDSLIYEAVILEIDEANGVCIVQYLGYDNEEEVSLDSLTRSQGKLSREKQIKAMQPNLQWFVGDMCRAQYSEDGLMYEAVILEIYDDGTCLVKYTNYDNEEVVVLKDLEPALGNQPERKESELSFISCQKEASGADEAGSSYSSDPSSMTASENDLTPSQSRNHPSRMKPDVPLDSGDMRRRRSSRDRHRNFPYEHSFMPSQHLPSPVNGDVSSLDDDLGSMLIAWYMAGYHTGYYQGRHARAESENRSRRFRDFH